MLEYLWTLLPTELRANPFFGGGFTLMILGAAMAYFREWPGKLWTWLKRCWMIEVDVLDRDPAFQWVDQWLAEHAYGRERARDLTVATRMMSYEDRQRDPLADHRPRILLSPGPGEHYLFYRGRLVILTRERPDMNSTAAQQSASVRESFRICVFSRDRRLAQQLIEDARDVALPPNDNRLEIYRP